MYSFTRDWFSNSDIQLNLKKHIKTDQPMHILEIGSFEGRSACWFSDNFLSDATSTLDCVDPYITSGTNSEITSLYVNTNIENRFHSNIRKSKGFDKITTHKMTSDDFFKTNNKTFNLIYIDGNHVPEYVTRDMENSFDCLEKNGIMWLDDYLYVRPELNIVLKIPIDDFLDRYKGKYSLLHKGRQIGIRRIV